ncbi:hypothetical protein QDY71_03050 [Kingella negevensis]|uniref:hypothetical protein n=1 Tax=Kingella negevensis TaxID=1522312 RepID=UPI002551869B|nr:hypothetical protein [Kingella negevensis]MDK4679594.1 hypothetical protein [Kingella negevensis]MDK4682688.1 hypothetical protein [Kingella negevensis]MDK4685269.1 hypothetical protein [Kingella negevensis]MDK4690885.1 hypothetical protein [Kingella negevensis]MDK4693968.1 hypothetical protein [Kingella negevensis]
MQPEKRAMAIFDLPSQTEGHLTSNRGLLHFVQWYQAEKYGWVDYSFATAPAMIVRLKPEAIYPAYARNRNASQHNLQKILDCQPYDYLVIRMSHNIDKAANWLQNNPKCKTMKLQYKAGDWLLFTKGRPQ